MNKMALASVFLLLLVESLAAPQFNFPDLSSLGDFGSSSSSSSSKRTGWSGTSATGSIISSGSNGSRGPGNTRHATPSDIGQLFGQSFSHHLALNPTMRTR